MTPTFSPPSTRSRIRLRFTLRLLLATLTLLCLLLGYWTHRAREQRRLVERIVRTGGHVEYDFPLEPRTDEPLDSSVPKWLLESLGVDHFHNVREVGTKDLLVLPELTRCWQLERLVVEDKTMTDADLAPIARLRSLTSLHVCLGDNETPLPPVGDRSLEMIAGLPRLQSVWVAGSRITRNGIESLAGSTSLRRVAVQCADHQVTAEVDSPFRQAGSVWYFEVVRILPDKAEKIVSWDTHRRQPVAKGR